MPARVRLGAVVESMQLSRQPIASWAHPSSPHRFGRRHSDKCLTAGVPSPRRHWPMRLTLESINRLYLIWQRGFFCFFCLLFLPFLFVCFVVWFSLVSLCFFCSGNGLQTLASYNGKSITPVRSRFNWCSSCFRVAVWFRVGLGCCRVARLPPSWVDKHIRFDRVDVFSSFPQNATPSLNWQLIYCIDGYYWRWPYWSVATFVTGFESLSGLEKSCRRNWSDEISIGFKLERDQRWVSKQSVGFPIKNGRCNRICPRMNWNRKRTARKRKEKKWSSNERVVEGKRGGREVKVKVMAVKAMQSAI